MDNLKSEVAAVLLQFLQMSALQLEPKLTFAGICSQQTEIDQAHVTAVEGAGQQINTSKNRPYKGHNISTIDSNETELAGI